VCLLSNISDVTGKYGCYGEIWSSLEGHALRLASQRHSHQVNEAHLASGLGALFHCRYDKERAAANREASAFCTYNAILEHKQFEKK